MSGQNLSRLSSTSSFTEAKLANKKLRAVKKPARAAVTGLLALGLLRRFLPNDLVMSSFFFLADRDFFGALTQVNKALRDFIYNTPRGRPLLLHFLWTARTVNMAVFNFTSILKRPLYLKAPAVRKTKSAEAAAASGKEAKAMDGSMQADAKSLQTLEQCLKYPRSQLRSLHAEVDPWEYFHVLTAEANLALMDFDEGEFSDADAIADPIAKITPKQLLTQLTTLEADRKKAKEYRQLSENPRYSESAAKRDKRRNQLGDFSKRVSRHAQLITDIIFLLKVTEVATQKLPEILDKAKEKALIHKLIQEALQETEWLAYPFPHVLPSPHAWAVYYSRNLKYFKQHCMHCLHPFRRMCLINWLRIDFFKPIGFMIL